MEKQPKVLIMGLGYIGLPTAALIANRGILVTGVDINSDIVKTINKGEIHIVEPDLAGLVKINVENKLLKASNKPEESDIFIITVPTPVKNKIEPDISYVHSAIEMIIPLIKPGNLIIIESTCPVGTTEKMSDFIYIKRPELKNTLYIAYCPERVLPGQIIHELEHNDRVIGGLDEESTKKALTFYSLFVRGNLHGTNAKTAEMCKLVENSYRDVNIAFANELSMICDKAGINVSELIALANRHPRVKILNPGVGVGGHCISIDPWFIVHAFKKEANLIKTARQVNNFKKEWVLNKIKQEIKNCKKHNPIIACMGLAFKPDVDDLRESPAFYITKKLIAEKYNILPVEPNVPELKGFQLVNCRKAVKKADIVVFLVMHKEFTGLTLPKNKIIISFTNKNV